MKWLLLLVLPIVAQMDSMVIFHHEPAVEALLESKVTGTERISTKVHGYRVQVYSSSDVQSGQVQAFQVEHMLREIGIDEPIYVQFKAPFWKVRLGDFTTIAEAEQLRDELLRLFPEWTGEVNVIRDDINRLQ